jgi:hypothetical protein
MWLHGALKGFEEVPQTGEKNELFDVFERERGHAGIVTTSGQTQSPHKMLCQDKVRLLRSYQAVTKKYCDAATELNRRMRALSKGEYDSLYRKTESLQAEVTRAQADFTNHVTVHRC